MGEGGGGEGEMVHFLRIERLMLTTELEGSMQRKILYTVT